MGAFAGRLSDSVIRRSASVNVSLKGLVAVGGIVGKTQTGALIEDCYVTGKVQGTYDHPRPWGQNRGHHRLARRRKDQQML